MNDDERECVSRCCYELDSIVLSTDIFLLDGNKIKFKTTSSRLDPSDKCLYDFLLNLICFNKTTFNSFKHLSFRTNQLNCSSLMFLNFCPIRFAILHQQNEEYDSSNLE